jgi:four helix bundle protein
MMPQQQSVSIMTPQEQLRQRTKKFALQIISLCRSLPNNSEGWVIGKQLLRSGTSVAANYRAAGRARSRAEFIAKIGIVVEEADEAVFWLELLEESGTLSSQQMQLLMKEACELLSIFSASYRTVRSRQTSQQEKG